MRISISEHLLEQGAAMVASMSTADQALDALTRRNPQLDEPIARVAVGAVLGLINSTP